MNNTSSNKNDVSLVNLNIISSITFIVASLVSLSITVDEKNRLLNKKRYYTNKEALNISFYNRIVILIAVLISLYVGYTNYKNEENDTVAKYKSSILLTTNILTVIGALLILYVSYLNKKEQTLNTSDVENPLI